MNPNIQQNLSMRIIEDLAKSGLEKDKDIKIMTVDDTVRAACNMSPQRTGYVISYHSIDGKRVPFYRVKIFKDNPEDPAPKYLQVKNTPNHIYFPHNFMGTFNSTGRKLIILTEGEKKAAAVSKYGIPCVALSGVDNYRNNITLIPKNLPMEPYPHNKNMVMVKASMEVLQEHTSSYATGFEELVELVRKTGCQLVICYDLSAPSDNPQVQRAAARVGYEFRNRGVSVLNIRQMYLPQLSAEGKPALDDFLVHKDGGIDKLKKLIHDILQKEVAFPTHPNIKEYIGKILNRPRITRKNYQELASIVTTDLDARGKRMFSPAEDQLYYFDNETKHLMKIQLNEDMRSAINETEFGKILYDRYEVSAVADSKMVAWLATQVPNELPIKQINPARIISKPAMNEDCVRFQLNDGQFIKVTGNPDKPFQILTNGEDDTLFTSDVQLPINGAELSKALSEVIKKPIKPWWFDVLKEVKLKDRGNAAMAMGLLYYISPWLYRWRGTQLPIEMVCGESGSGKSTLVSLRLNILTGQASLKNAPTDLKDWYASITKSGGMHVIDNLHFTDKQLAQRMSDELCRLVTEPNPAIEQRKYFTNADIIRFPINAIFSFTAIKQPFNNADLIQRSFILELDKVQALEADDSGELEVKDYAFDGYWLQHQMDRFGGRVNWIAHHIWVLHNFFKLVKTEWDPKYKAKYRLINLEQAMILMSKVLGVENGEEWIPSYLSSTTNKIIQKSDWTLDGLKAYADHRRKHGMEADFSAADITMWCNSQEDYEENHMLKNARTLGRYLAQWKYNIATIAGIIESRRVANKQFYNVTKQKP